MKNDDGELYHAKADKLDSIDYLFYHVIDEYEGRGINMDDVIQEYENGHLKISDIRMYAQGTLNLRDF